MYSYEWDTETGGLILNSTPLQFSKEPRPVYYKELDILGFDKYWKYKKDDTYPYMWAEANNYWYKGRKVAKTKGGACYSKPEIEIFEEPEVGGKPLEFVNIEAMVEKNKDILEGLVQETIKKIYNTYVEYKDKIDVFYVAFSGGKDSIVTLDLVQRTLPHNEFMVLFGDTKMEFPDTYDTVDEIEKRCKKSQIKLVRSSSEFSPDETWNIFGTPATVNRWCCSVHKTSPQIKALRKYTNKNNFTGMAFVGVRASESISRSEYEYVGLGDKHKGQYNCNPIIEWNSAELYVYIYYRNLYINKAYKKGNRRAGCLVCPRAAERNDYMSRVCYKGEFEKYINIIRKLYSKSFDNKDKLEEFIANGGWKARKNGRDIDIDVNYSEETTKEKLVIEVKNPKVDWKIWIKTIGKILNENSPYIISYKNDIYEFEVIEKGKDYYVNIDIDLVKKAPTFIKMLKNVFRKAACCVGCGECEADCHNGCITMNGGNIQISDNCIHCSQCHKVEKGCLIYKSLEMPKGVLKMQKNASLNRYSHHSPKIGWIEQFFKYKDEFEQENSLGSQQYSFFKTYLRDSGLTDNSNYSETAEIINNIGLDSEISWGIMLVNLSYTPQINWYVKRMPVNEESLRDYVIDLLISDGAKESWAKDVWSSFGRFTELPFNKVGIGSSVKKGRRLQSITRTPWLNPDARVVLYSLYKFAEACGGYYQFTLNRLLNHEIESDGVSPTEIFGIDRDAMKKLLEGLAINYPDFINVSFTLDLDNITLKSDKSSEDVLKLF